METIQDVVSDEEVEKMFENTDFGGVTPRDVLKFGILKCASGYYQGYTSKTILEELKLISKAYNLTSKGRSYLWLVFKGQGKI